MTDRSALLADIGATHARFALGRHDEISGFRSFNCADYPSLEAAADAYLDAEQVSHRPKRGAFALAGPVSGDLIRMTNLPWQFSVAEIRDRLRFDRLEIVNDFTAIAWSIPCLSDQDRVKLGGGESVDGGVIGILGPGTGLGVSALVRATDGGIALSTEGGHVTLPSTTDRESAVVGELRKQFGHVSAERALSGPGLINLYGALCAIDRVEPRVLDPAELCRLAVERRNPHCHEALGMFCSILGAVAGNLALTYGATGGIYVAGGIAGKIVPFLTASHFRERFLEKGRMRSYLASIPTYLVTHESPALLGLRAHVFKT